MWYQKRKSKFIYMNMNNFRKIKPKEITRNPFLLIGSDWFLLSAGNTENFNTMTASWGGMGVLWNKNVVFCFVRPPRFTYQFMEQNEFFTMCFFDEKYKEALNLCGSVSGRDIDKMKETGLSPIVSPNGSVFYSQAKLMFECRKIYFSDIDPQHFLLQTIDANYPKKDYHRMYFGEIVSCYENILG